MEFLWNNLSFIPWPTTWPWFPLGACAFIPSQKRATFAPNQIKCQTRTSAGRFSPFGPDSRALIPSDDPRLPCSALESFCGRKRVPRDEYRGNFAPERALKKRGRKRVIRNAGLLPSRGAWFQQGVSIDDLIIMKWKWVFTESDFTLFRLGIKRGRRCTCARVCCTCTR